MLRKKHLVRRCLRCAQWTLVGIHHQRDRAIPTLRSLTVIHEDSDADGPWHLTPIKVGVDSGQAGFFDDDLYPEGDPGEFTDADSFYGQACKLTLNGNIAGCLDFGANAQSGWGDGCYECFVKCNEHGVAVAARIVFINEDE